MKQKSTKIIKKHNKFAPAQNLSNKRIFAVCVALFVIIFAIYHAMGRAPFVFYDDDEYVFQNAHIQNGVTLDSIKWAFTSGYASNWHPLTWISHMIDWQAYRDNAGGHHITNVLFHIFNAWLLFGFFVLSTKNVWVSAFIAALFAVHPTHVESVAWVSERKDVLCCFFWILTMIAHWAFVQTKSKKWYAASILCFLMALMSKPMAVTLPIILLLLDYWPLHRLQKEKPDDIKKLLLEKAPLFILAAASSAVTYYVQKEGGAMGNAQLYPFGIRFANAMVSYVSYIAKMFIPVNLAVIYPHPGHNLPMWKFVLAIPFLVVATWLAIKLRKRKPYLFVGWLWFLIALIPVIGFIQVGVQAMADRYTYIPYTGLFFALSYLIYDHLFANQIGASKTFFYRRVACVASFSIIFVFSALAYRQTLHWNSTIDLFRHAVNVTKANIVANNNLGRALFDAGRSDEAIPYLLECLKIDPFYRDANYNLGVIHTVRGDDKTAKRYYENILVAKPNDAIAHNNIGVVWSNWGNYEKALEKYMIAVKCNEKYVDAWMNLAMTCERLNRIKQAKDAYIKVTQLDPNRFEAHYNLAVLLDKAGDLDAAILEYETASKLNPQHAYSKYNLGVLYHKKHRYFEAIQAYEAALRIDDGIYGAHNNLGLLYGERGDFEKAIYHCKKAIEINPHDAAAKINLRYIKNRQKNECQL